MNLLPCPFCGSDNVACSTVDEAPLKLSSSGFFRMPPDPDFVPYVVVLCEECGASGQSVPRTSLLESDRAMATSSWNRRCP